MKRLIISAICAICGFTAAEAQTNFRAITYQQALEAAKAEGKPVFIDFYTSWCGPCKMMARDVFPQQKVGDYFNDNFVCIKLDAEKEGKEQAKKYNVTAYPTFKVVSADEKEIFTLVGGNTDASAFIADVKAGVNPDLSPDRTAARYAQGERSAELVATYAAQLVKESQQNRRNPDQSKADKAQQIVDEYFNSLTTEGKLDEENNFVYAYNYCNNPKDAKARFLIENMQKMTDQRRTEAQNTLRTLYLYRTGTLLQGLDEFDQSDVDLLKNDITALGFDKGDEQAYAATFRILSAQTDSDRNKYLSQLEKDFGQMNVSQKASVAGNFAHTLRSEEPAVIERADKWLRSQLATLDAATIYYVANSLMQFEKQLNK